MQYKNFLLLVIFIFVSFYAAANNVWHSGVVVLKDSTVLNGDLQLNSEFNLLQVKSDGKVQTFSARYVALFYIYDKELNLLRKHISIPYIEGGRSFGDMFFEEIIKGEISLLRKKAVNYDKTILEEEVYAAGGYLITDNVYQHVISFDYYYKMSDLIIHSDRFEKEFLPWLQVNYNDHQELDSYISAEKFKVYKLHDQVQIIRFVNDLISKNTQSLQSKAF